MHRFQFAKLGSAPTLTRRQSGFVLGVGALMVICGLVLTLSAQRGSSSRQLPAKAQMPYAIGRVINQGAVTFTVNSVVYRPGSGSFTAPAGSRYAIIEIAVTNRSDAPVQVLPSSDIYLKTASGDVAYLTPYTLDRPFRAGELPPGETIKGELSYLVSEQQTYGLYVDGGWSGGVLPFSLSAN